jgi:AP endonuclease 2
MFDILDADIVVLQETKIQRKDLRDDMVLVPGWDVYFSLPKHKKGYSGVAIYTRNTACAPIRAEEGIIGVLCPPSSSTPFRELPEDQQIGGYPCQGQLKGDIDDLALDSEGRCVILEFPAFVLIGTYSPAARDESRDDFRLGYLEALDVRIRNLVAMGKRVVLTGDLNVIRADIDTANISERLRKESMTMQDFFSSPSRRLFNHLVFDGTIYEDRDETREDSVLWDLGRLFNPNRQGMFTCWETKKNARPGNFGSRIDYVLCSDNMKDWIVDSNIQEGLMGSDHCPVYATISDMIKIDSREIHLRDLMNPEGMFRDGKRLREWSTKDLLPTSARLIPEFDRRRSIKDMFFKKPSTSNPPFLPKSESSISSNIDAQEASSSLASNFNTLTTTQSSSSTPKVPPTKTASSGMKRNASSASPSKSQKRTKSGQSKEPPNLRGQSSLMGFFKPKPTEKSGRTPDTNVGQQVQPGLDGAAELEFGQSNGNELPSTTTSKVGSGLPTPASPAKFIDPIESKESWSRLLGKRVLPRCEHGEDCISLVTKKPGINCGN